MSPRVYLPGVLAGTAQILSVSQAHHLTKVLRLKSGARLIAFDGCGNAYDAVLSGGGGAAGVKGQVVLDVRRALPPSPLPPRAVHVGQMLCAANKMDWAIEKMTELGAASITPLLENDGKKAAAGAASGARQARWQRLIIAACEQCGRNTLPALLPPMTLENWRQGGQAGQLGDLGAAAVLLTPRGQKPLKEITDEIIPAVPLVLTAGSEAGFPPGEEEKFQAAGFSLARLGPNTLRAETAAMAALAVLLCGY